MNNRSKKWIIGQIQTPRGVVPKIATKLTFSDIAGSWKARWGIKRMRYKIDPGLYAVGDPDDQSPVFVSANYKMSFDRLRKELSGIASWILVLDTKGINVWCAAGKGTFGTDEIVKRAASVGLHDIVVHRKLILPQLGAPGVAAHKVKQQSGFRVVFGPVRACDIQEFLNRGLEATPEMRRVGFSLFDRLVLTPMELVGVLKPLIIISGSILLLNLAGVKFFSVEDLVPFIGAIVVGGVLIPVFLPWIPGRALAFKGWILGGVYAAGINISYGWLLTPDPSWKQSLVMFLVLPSLSAFMAMNFTGSTTYTSLSGVVREMRIALPLIIISAGSGIAFSVLIMFYHF